MTPLEPPKLADVCAAARRLASHLHETPLVRSRTLSERCGVELFLKCENLQKTGCFKPRGGLNRIATLDPEERDRGVITISAGNHAQGVAYAAGRLDVPAVVVMPESAPAAKVAATWGYGAECVLHGDVHAAFERMEELRRQRSLVLVHPFDDPMLVAGHGTAGWEIHQRLPDVDGVICGVGGGGLLAGICTALAELVPEVPIWGVEPEGAPTMTRALESGRPVRLEDLDTIADGLAPPFVGELTLDVVRRHAAGIVTVSDDAIRRAMALLLERTKLLVEPAGAAGLAALLDGRIRPEPGSRVVVVLSGGSLDVSRLAEILAPDDAPS